jgi:hypothetical protein
LLSGIGVDAANDLHIEFDDVTGVIIPSMEHGENLAKGMFTGRKRPE